jgi:hypothetical protein
MSDVTVVTVPDGETPATDDVVEAVVETAEAVAEAVAGATDDDSAVEAVDKVIDLSHERRITILEQEMMNKADRSELERVRETAWNASDTAYEAAAAATEALDAADDATEPGEVEAMIEATEVVETDDGETVLDAPSDVPPPGAGTHWAFADRKTLTERFKAWLS